MSFLWWYLAFKVSVITFFKLVLKCFLCWEQWAVLNGSLTAPVFLFSTYKDQWFGWICWEGLLAPTFLGILHNSDFSLPEAIRVHCLSWSDVALTWAFVYLVIFAFWHRLYWPTPWAMRSLSGKEDALEFAIKSPCPKFRKGSICVCNAGVSSRAGAVKAFIWGFGYMEKVSFVCFVATIYCWVELQIVMPHSTLISLCFCLFCYPVSVISYNNSFWNPLT